MLYLVDGYNVTHSDPATSSLAIEEQRGTLVARLRTRGADLLGRGRIVVVFDGAESTVSPSTGTTPVRVQFARGQTADDLIVKLAEETEGPVCVVTSDGGLASRLKGALSGRVEIRPRESVYDAAGGGRRRAGRTRSGRDDGSFGVPPGGRAITKELEGLWLDEENEG